MSATQRSIKESWSVWWHVGANPRKKKSGRSEGGRGKTGRTSQSKPWRSMGLRSPGQTQTGDLFPWQVPLPVLSCSTSTPSMLVCPVTALLVTASLPKKMRNSWFFLTSLWWWWHLMPICSLNIVKFQKHNFVFSQWVVCQVFVTRSHPKRTFCLMLETGHASVITARRGRRYLTWVRWRLPFGADERAVLILTSFLSNTLFSLSDLKVWIYKNYQK